LELAGLVVAFWSEDASDYASLRFIEAVSNAFGGGAEDDPQVEKKGRMGAREREGLIGSRAILLSSIISILINTI
jgi:hypothetical protein